MKRSEQRWEYEWAFNAPEAATINVLMCNKEENSYFLLW